MSTTERPDEVRSPKGDAPTDSAASRDVLREAGIETFNRHAMSGHPDVLSMVLVRLADVEGLVRERDDYKAALREVQDNIRASVPQTAGRVPSPETTAGASSVPSDAEERAVWWEAETRRILKALTTEGTDVVQRVTTLALSLREAAKSGVLPPNAPDSPVSRPSVGGGER